MTEPRSKDASARYVAPLRFAWLTPLYDVVVKHTTREAEFKQALIKQAAFEPGQNVLDLACGTGTLAIWIKAGVPSLVMTGIDGDDKVLDLAIEKARRARMEIQFDRGLSYDLPYDDERYDKVVSTLFFHHLAWSDKLRTAREVHRVLAPGGEFYVADWGYASGITRAAFTIVQLLDGIANTAPHVKGELPSVFLNAGFESVIEESRYHTMLGNISLIRCVKGASRFATSSAGNHQEISSDA